MDGSSTDAGSTVERSRSFALDVHRYERLLRRLVDAGCAFVGFDDREAGVVLHHDVELSLDRALTMARLETTLRIRGTYFLPIDAPVHDVSTVRFDRSVRTLARLGHDVGLQFDPRRHWEERPSQSALESKIDEERRGLQRLLGESVDVVSFRRPPEWAREVELDGFVNATRPPAIDDYRVFDDREFRTEDPFEGSIPERFQLVVHPGLWFDESDERDPLDARRRAALDQVDEYFEPFDVP